MLKVSIIVPVYQAENYINRCLDSIRAQTFKDFEVILIDDGSQDNSGYICDCYAKKDSRFHVIHKKNEGVSIARQTGLDAAQGEYVIHADPDDWVEPDWIEKLYGKIEEEKADMVICDFERIYADRKVHYVQKPTSFEQMDLLKDLLNEKLWGPCWNKLIRRDCFTKYDVRFNPKMNLWEDLYVTCSLIVHGIKVAYVPLTLYHYDSAINENSIVMHKNSNHIRSCMIFIDDFSSILSSKDYDDEWYRMKSKVKDWIFTVNDCKYSIKKIKKIYPEINQRYINDAKRYPLLSKRRCIALCIKGYPIIAKWLYIIVKRKHIFTRNCH